jgi:catechol 2,3-dioxygenase-like lactoylglutathione lyase family enzyme
VQPGSLHHVEVNVSDLGRSGVFWAWLLDWLGYAPWQEWPKGRSWILGDAYVVLVQAEEPHRSTRFDRRGPGLNHLAFHAASREEVDSLVRDLRARGVGLLYEDRHPHAGGTGSYAAFFEDPERIKVEVAAPDPRDVPDAAALLEAYAAAHEEGRARGRFDALAALFRRDGRLVFDGFGPGVLEGRVAIREAFRCAGPDDGLRLATPASPAGDTASASYAWRREPERSAGRLFATAREGRIAELRVTSASSLTREAPRTPR